MKPHKIYICSSAINAITNPSKDVTLSFVQAGSIASINYREGDLVKVGDVLVQQDDTVEQIRLAQLEAESKDTSKVKAAELTLKQRNVDLKRVKAAGAAVTETEVDYAELNLQIAELQLRVAEIQHEQANKKYEEAKSQIERMRLKSPIEGRIEKIEIESGESVRALDNVVRVVRTDPLWIDADVDLAETSKLEYGDRAIVQFPAPNETTVEGTIIFIASVADAASDTLRVRIQTPNKSNRPAGERVGVTFPKLK
jgi:RND family efflux transporter MFP subunit